LNALTVGAAQLGLRRGDYLSGGRSGLRWRSWTHRCLSMGRRRGTRADQPVGKAFRRGFGLPAEQPECLVKPIDKVDDVIASPFCVGGDLPGEIRALNGNRRNQPRRQSAQCEKRNCEKERNGLSASKRSARHFRHQRIEQIGKNCGDRHRDQNWLEKTDDASAGPDDGGNNDH